MEQKKIIWLGVISAIFIIIVFGLLFAFEQSHSFIVPNFIGEEWATKNKVAQAEPWELDVSEAYSLIYDTGTIISQDIPAGKRRKNKTVIHVVVSLGPNMTEVVELPNFMNMTLEELMEWRDEWKMASAITIREEFSSSRKKGEILAVDLDEQTDVTEFTRQDHLTIIVSKGLPSVKLPNFTEVPFGTRQAVLSWMAKNPGIDVEFLYEELPELKRDTVIAQSEEPSQVLTAGEQLTIVLASGPAVIVPNFFELSTEDAIAAGEQLGLNLRVRYRFNEDVPYGALAWQSVDPGEELYETDTVITLNYSEGFPWIPKLYMEQEIQDFVQDLNEKGAFLTWEIIRVRADEERGTILSQNIYNQRVDLVTHLIFTVSSGD